MTLKTRLCLQAERSGCDANILSIPVPIRRGGSESNLDVVDSVGRDGVGVDFTKGALGIDVLQQKILKVKRWPALILQTTQNVKLMFTFGNRRTLK